MILAGLLMMIVRRDGRADDREGGAFEDEDEDERITDRKILLNDTRNYGL